MRLTLRIASILACRLHTRPRPAGALSRHPPFASIGFRRRQQAYIAVEGRDGCLWFCESAPRRSAGSTPGHTRSPSSTCRHRMQPRSALSKAQTCILVRRKDRQQDRPHHHRRNDYRIPSADTERWSGRDDGRSRRQHLVLTDRGEPDRAYHARRAITSFKDGITPAGKATLHRRSRRRNVVQRGGGRPHWTPDGERRDHRISDPSKGSQPRAMCPHPDGSIWFVQTSANGSAGSTATAA